MVVLMAIWAQVIPVILCVCYVPGVDWNWTNAASSQELSFRAVPTHVVIVMVAPMDTNPGSGTLLTWMGPNYASSPLFRTLDAEYCIRDLVKLFHPGNYLHFTASEVSYINYWDMMMYMYNTRMKEGEILSGHLRHCCYSVRKIHWSGNFS